MPKWRKREPKPLPLQSVDAARTDFGDHVRELRLTSAQYPRIRHFAGAAHLYETLQSASATRFALLP